MIFTTREAAGRMLASKLQEHRGALVLALPRGGLPVASPIAAALGGTLDVLVARKLGAPGQDEFAIGAVTAQGDRVLNEQALRHLWLPPGYLERKTAEQQEVARRREAFFRGVRAPEPLAGRVVILVDDGVATGMTMRAAIAAARRQAPARLVVAAPVMAPDTYRELATLADEVVALAVPAGFRAVGQFYENFPQLSDEEARDVLLAVRP